jgi:hypothetical protein
MEPRIAGNLSAALHSSRRSSDSPNLLTRVCSERGPVGWEL